jgi:hypothetical protein
MVYQNLGETEAERDDGLCCSLEKAVAAVFIEMCLSPACHFISREIS